LGNLGFNPENPENPENPDSDYLKGFLGWTLWFYFVNSKILEILIQTIFEPDLTD
jgi:hypothetical protein